MGTVILYDRCQELPNAYVKSKLVALACNKDNSLDPQVILVLCMCNEREERDWMGRVARRGVEPRISRVKHRINLNI